MLTAPSRKQKPVWLESRMKSIRAMPTKPSWRETLSFYCLTKIPLHHKTTSYTPRTTIRSFTTYYEPRTTHRFSTTHFPHPTSHFPLPTPHIPHPIPFVIPDERRQPRDLGSRPGHRPVTRVLRIDSTTGCEPLFSTYSYRLPLTRAPSASVPSRRRAASSAAPRRG